MTGSTVITTEFLGATLWGMRGEDRQTTKVAMKPIVEGMGLDWSSQSRKLREHPIIGPTMVIMTMVAEDGALREVATLPLVKLPFWLATVHTARIPDDQVRARVIEFQRRVCDVLEEAFFGRAEEQSAAAPAASLPWRERPLAERRVEIDTAALLLRADSPERALHYIDNELRIPGAMPADKKRPPGLFTDDHARAREIMTFARGEMSGETH